MRNNDGIRRLVTVHRRNQGGGGGRSILGARAASLVVATWLIRRLVNGSLRGNRQVSHAHGLTKQPDQIQVQCRDNQSAVGFEAHAPCHSKPKANERNGVATTYNSFGKNAANLNFCPRFTSMQKRSGYAG